MSLPYSIYNEEYRDMTGKSQYPFMDTSTLTNGIVSIPAGMLLDLLIYVSGDFEAPYYVSSVNGLSGNDDQAMLTVTDTGGKEVGTALLDKTLDTCYIKQGTSIQAGVIVYNQEYMIKFLGTLGKSRTVFTQQQTALAAGQCFAIHPGNIVAVGGPDKLHSGDAVIRSDNGVTFTTYNDGSDDVLVIHLYGESTAHPGAVASINGVVFPERHVWFAAHPDSQLRVLTQINEIEVAYKKDIDYGN